MPKKQADGAPSFGCGRFLEVRGQRSSRRSHRRISSLASSSRSGPVRRPYGVRMLVLSPERGTEIVTRKGPSTDVTGCPRAADRPSARPRTSRRTAKLSSSSSPSWDRRILPREAKPARALLRFIRRRARRRASSSLVAEWSSIAPALPVRSTRLKSSSLSRSVPRISDWIRRFDRVFRSRGFLGELATYLAP